jgi:hypothetical protein
MEEYLVDDGEEARKEARGVVAEFALLAQALTDLHHMLVAKALVLLLGPQSAVDLCAGAEVRGRSVGFLQKAKGVREWNCAVCERTEITANETNCTTAEEGRMCAQRNGRIERKEMEKLRGTSAYWRLGSFSPGRGAGAAM